MPLTYRDRHTSGTQLDVLSGNLRIASLYKATLAVVASQTVQWRWTFNVTVGPSGFNIHGTADTLEEAKARIEENWQTWLKEAGLTET